MLGRFVLPALAGTVIFWAAPAGLLAKPVSRSAPRRPVWLTEAPEPAKGKLFFIGMNTGAHSLEAGREAALKDAAAQAAFYVMAKLSAKSLYYSSPVASRLYEELRSAPRGALQGVRVRDLYWERWQGDGKAAAFDVWALVEVPSAQISSERKRLRKADEELAAKLERLCAGVFPALGARTGAKTQVSGIKEAASGSRFPFSRILEENLRGCLIRQGVAVSSSGPAELMVTGDYWESPDSVTVSVKAFSSRDGLAIGSWQEVLPRDAVEPLWLRGDEEDLALFSAPSQAEAPSPLPGAVAVRSEPAGARVYLDGVDRGLTPSVLGGVQPGSRSVVLALRDYVPYSTEAEVEPDAKTLVSAKLERKTGTLSVKCVPDGAEVRLDGAFKGRSPLGPMILPTGSYQVALRLKDHKPWSQKVDIPYGGETSLDPTLEEDEGSLFILVEPAGADILVDGALVGRSASGKPLRLDKTASGPRQVSARKKGFVAQDWSVRVRPHRTTSVTGALLPAPPEAEPIAPSPEPSRPYEDASRAFNWSNHKPSSPPFWSGFSNWFARPSDAYYFDGVGGTIGGNYNNVRVLEYVYYFGDSWLGAGSSLLTVSFGNYHIIRTDPPISYGQTAPSQNRVSFTMLSFLPLQFYIVPLVHTYRKGDQTLMASLQLYANLCYWSFANINDDVAGAANSNATPYGSVEDFGVLLNPGAVLGVRAGYVETRLRPYAYGSSTYTGFKDHKLYVAADVSIGWYAVNQRR